MYFVCVFNDLFCFIEIWVRYKIPCCYTSTSFLFWGRRECVNCFLERYMYVMNCYMICTWFLCILTYVFSVDGVFAIYIHQYLQQRVVGHFSHDTFTVTVNNNSRPSWPQVNNDLGPCYVDPVNRQNHQRQWIKMEILYLLVVTILNNVQTIVAPCTPDYVSLESSSNRCNSFKGCCYYQI